MQSLFTSGCTKYCVTVCLCFASTILIFSLYLHHAVIYLFRVGVMKYTKTQEQTWVQSDNDAKNLEALNTSRLPHLLAPLSFLSNFLHKKGANKTIERKGMKDSATITQLHICFLRNRSDLCRVYFLSGLIWTQMFRQVRMKLA